jgi:L-iditol 2-dehydrogenase
MMEPLSVGLWAAKRGEVEPGDSVAVFGCGPIGLLTLQAAKAAGATTLIAVDIEERRLQHARRLGATHILEDRQGDSVGWIKEITSGLHGFGPDYSGVDVAFETAGAVAATRNALAVTRPGGVAVLVGLPPESMIEIDLVSASSKEIDIRGQFRYANRYPPAIALTAEGRIDVASLVTHHFPLQNAKEALRFADEHKAESLKVMVDVGD